MQVRATEAFKKGTLILAPAYGEMKLASSYQRRSLHQLQKNMHAALLSHVDATVVTALGRTGKPNKVPATATKQHFVMHSPLLAMGPAKKEGPEQKLENVAPFWALLRAGGPSSPHNMEIDTVSFRDLGFEAMGSAYPKLPKGISCTACLPIARNVTHISPGELLTLPYMHAKDPED